MRYKPHHPKLKLLIIRFSPNKCSRNNLNWSILFDDHTSKKNGDWNSAAVFYLLSCETIQQEHPIL